MLFTLTLTHLSPVQGIGRFTPPVVGETNYLMPINVRICSSRKLLKTTGETIPVEAGKPYGERPGESEIRDRIKAMRRAAATLQAICDTFDKEGIKTRLGRRWMPITVARIAAR